MMNALRWPARRSCRYATGAVAVEFALVVPVVIILIFGTIEFGLIFKDLLIINQAAREGARAGALGAPTSVIVSKVMEPAGTLATDRISITMQYRNYMPGAWGEWHTLVDIGSPVTNCAIPGAQVRVRVEYGHALATGKMFTRWADDADGTLVTLRGGSLVRRE